MSRGRAEPAAQRVWAVVVTLVALLGATTCAKVDQAPPRVTVFDDFAFGE